MYNLITIDLIGFIKNLLGIHSPSKVFMDIGEEIVSGLSDGLSEKWEKLKSNVLNAIENIKSAFKRMGESITSTMNKINTSVQNVWDKIKTGTKNFINNGLIAGVEKLINSVLAGLRWLLGKAQAFINTLPENVQNKLGLSKIGNATINDVHLDRFATGGFPEDGLFMANHGELVGQFANGRTAVANNEQIEAGIEEAAYRGFMRAMSGQGGNYTFVAQLNGKTIFEEVVRQNNSATKAYGMSPLSAY